MAETKVVNLEVKTNVEPLKKQLKEAQKEVEALAAKFGATSDAAVNAAKKAAELKDRIGDAKALTDAFNPDAKFNALSNSLGGVANGFAAYQGALGLVGVESKDLEKQLLKVQSAMALSQGLQGLGEARDSFRQLGAVAKNVFTGIKGAIGGLGIGIIILAIGAIVANWKELTKWVEKSFPAFAKIGEFFNNFRQVASGTISSVIAGFKAVATVLGDVFRGDFSKALKDAKNVGSKMSEAYNKGFDEKDKELRTERYIKQKAFEIELAKARGQDVLNEQLNLQRKQLSLLDKGSEEYNAKLIEIEATKTAIKEREQAKQDKADEAYKAKREKRRNDELAAIAEWEKKKANRIAQQAADAQELADAKKFDNDKFAQEVKHLQDVAAANKAAGEKIIENDKKVAAEKKQIKQLEFDAVRNSFNTIANLAELFAGKSRKEQKAAFEIQKAANIAGATMDTYKAATGAYSSLASIPVVGVGLGIAAATAATVAGLLNVKKIASTQFTGSASGGGGGSTASSSGGGGGATNQAVTPNFNIVGNNGLNQLSQLKQAPVQAYVVSGQMSTAQSLDRNRVRNATL